MCIAVIICVFLPILAESGSSAKTYLWSNNVTDLYLFLLHEKRLVHTIQFRTQTDTGRIVGHPIETINSIIQIRVQLMFFHIICLVHLTGIPPLCIVDRRRNLQILEQRESSTDRNIMIHRIFPSADSGLEQTVIFCSDTVCQTSRITDGNLFIPTLGSGSLLTLEREKTAQRNIKVGERHGDRRVTHSLRNIGSSGQGQTNIGETAGIADT